MRDITHKITTLRSATAKASLKIDPKTFHRFQSQDFPKGDPLPVAKVAAIQAAKQTDALIPYCHPIPIEAVDVDFTVEPESIHVCITVKAIYKTGVEMEALTAASVAALTIYDMLKMVDDSMEITSVCLLEKKGGKSNQKIELGECLTALVLTISDSISAGIGTDQSGPLIVECLQKHAIPIVQTNIIPDDLNNIIQTIKAATDIQGIHLIITTGGTGVGLRDNTPEALKELLDKEIPGLSEMLRTYGQTRTPYAMLSRANAGIRGNGLIISLPGSRSAVQDAMDVLFPYILHVFHVLKGGKHSVSQPAERVRV